LNTTNSPSLTHLEQLGKSRVKPSVIGQDEGGSGGGGGSATRKTKDANFFSSTNLGVRKTMMGPLNTYDGGMNWQMVHQQEIEALSSPNHHNHHKHPHHHQQVRGGRNRLGAIGSSSSADEEDQDQEEGGEPRDEFQQNTIGVETTSTGSRLISAAGGYTGGDSLEEEEEDVLNGNMELTRSEKAEAVRDFLEERDEYAMRGRDAALKKLHDEGLDSIEKDLQAVGILPTTSTLVAAAAAAGGEGGGGGEGGTNSSSNDGGVLHLPEVDSVGNFSPTKAQLSILKA